MVIWDRARALRNMEENYKVLKAYGNPVEVDRKFRGAVKVVGAGPSMAGDVPGQGVVVANQSSAPYLMWAMQKVDWIAVIDPGEAVIGSPNHFDNPADDVNSV